MINIKSVSASGTYNKMETSRQSFLNRAREASKLTIPQMYPRMNSDNTATTTYATPYQSLGARGVNNLANKIILSLFPPATAFFKLGMNKLAEKASGSTEGDIKNAMYTIEKGIVNEMEVSQLRAVLVDAIKQCIIGGSSVLHIPSLGKPKLFNLKDFGVKRSKSGTVLKLVIKEKINFLELDKDIQDQLTDLDDKERDGSKDLVLYTMALRSEDGDYHLIQEIKGTKIDGTYAVYKEKDFPYIFIPFVDRGEDFGRSYVEDYIGDLMSYEGLRQSILEAAAESARLIYLVKPNAVITPKKLQKARSGDVLLGKVDDVATLQADKRLDVSMAQQEAEVLRTDLSTIFLLDSAVRRNAERVTAEEIRRVSQELEVALGGIYSTLANVVQEPLVRLYLARLVRKKMIPNILANNVELEITTGSAALGRGSEFRALESFMSTAVQLLGPDANKYLNVPEALNRMAYSLDVNTGDLVKSQEQLQAEQQAAQQAQMQQQAVAPTINAANQQQLQQQKQSNTQGN